MACLGACGMICFFKCTPSGGIMLFYYYRWADHFIHSLTWLCTNVQMYKCTNARVKWWCTNIPIPTAMPIYNIQSTTYNKQHATYNIHHTPYTIHHTPYTIHHTTYNVLVHRVRARVNVWGQRWILTVNFYSYILQGTMPAAWGITELFFPVTVQGKTNFMTICSLCHDADAATVVQMIRSHASLYSRVSPFSCLSDAFCHAFWQFLSQAVIGAWVRMLCFSLLQVSRTKRQHWHIERHICTKDT